MGRGRAGLSPCLQTVAPHDRLHESTLLVLYRSVQIPALPRTNGLMVDMFFKVSLSLFHL